jgi:hypothetical protein
MKPSPIRLSHPPRNRSHHVPLDEIRVTGLRSGVLVVRDGAGRAYVRQTARPGTRFVVAGALGTHLVSVEDKNGKASGPAVPFSVRCETRIEDSGGRYGQLLRTLYYTMIHCTEPRNQVVLGEVYRFFVCWLRDHVHTLKGMKYFDADLESAIDLYRDTQREDGMIWDNVQPRPPYKHYWDQVFSRGDFVRQLPPGTVELKRVPVENDVEYLFIEGLYQTWKATGDDAWMKRGLDAAVAAVRYATSDPSRFSPKLGLLKRGYTIDTWDFQPDEDSAWLGDKLSAMTIDPKRTRFGIFHGDNTGMARSLSYLADMLAHAGRAKEAPRYRELGADLKRRLDALSWNGAFYTHHVPEDPAVTRDLGAPETERFSMSNAYALNRGISADQGERIIGKYLELREALPPGGAGEFFTMYPHYPKGFSLGQGEYMNMGVTPIVAGELARGAFVHGFERYGVDILERVGRMAARHGGYLPCCFRGIIERPSGRAFTPLSIAREANVDFRGEGAPGVVGWTGDADNDLAELPVGRQVFRDIPFEIPDPATNGRRGCIGLSAKPGYTRSASVAVGTAARSIYWLHALSGGSGLAGTAVIEYEDGTSHARHLYRNSEVTGFWMPEHPPPSPGLPALQIAWEGKNASCLRVGISLFGMNVPDPNKTIARLRLEAASDGAIWFVAAVTLGREEMWLEPSEVSYGIPDNWGAAAVVYALIEGLAGVVDEGVAFDRVRLAPRWAAAGVREVTAHVTYPASEGYVSYRYRHRPRDRAIALVVAGNGKTAHVAVLLPEEAARVSEVRVDGAAHAFAAKSVRQSRYAVLDVDLGPARRIEITYARS